MDETAFIASILENPLDPGPRLVYADWLEESGNPRGGVVRERALLWVGEQKEKCKECFGTGMHRVTIPSRTASLIGITFDSARKCSHCGGSGRGKFHSVGWVMGHDEMVCAQSPEERVTVTLQPPPMGVQPPTPVGNSVEGYVQHQRGHQDRITHSTQGRFLRAVRENGVITEIAAREYAEGVRRYLDLRGVESQIDV